MERKKRRGAEKKKWKRKSNDVGEEAEQTEDLWNKERLETRGRLKRSKK